MTDFAERRARMVERQLRARGIGDERVLAAMAAVPREAFVPARSRGQAYSDSALPIGSEQTISQPWIVAAICQALALGGSERVLEVGTGSGYSAAVLARLAAEVVSIERHRELAEAAREALAGLGVGNVEVIVGDGSRGLPDRAPFEAIAVHAAAPTAPPALLSQLADGGRMVVPIAADSVELLTLLHRRGEQLETTNLGPCRFVPLIGEEGY
jgi:protein-L-isoaspartate(D-aspartate) O-methyltransferase